ncbi:FKBP-type peptidyl-prolyl cis-trans isomerase [Rubrivirga marina]|uniref:Peptidyl-prolyl cis-trans isomerase n=1 Tax=Rubrivirga marina TaxID=1196024 RepID=A0A271IY64_9BACT|nr:FKBP-type peptidyl-prolyl cis-trans isomerase [Rubrivirga marina]PAP76070.1 hypothetical protein BSZ37_06240 [Rubrivirga marina]
MRTPRLLVRPALVGLIALAAGAPALSGCDSGGSAVCPTDVAFDIEDVTPDSVQAGDAIQQGDCISVAYVGRVAESGGIFSRGDDRRFVFPNDSRLPRGFILGLAGQQVGETRIVTVPPNLGYGPVDVNAGVEGLADVPSCSVLEFEITLNRIYQDNRSCSGS